MKDQQPGEDEKFAQSVAGIVAYANANITTLGLTPADVAALSGANINLEAKIAATEATKLAARNAVKDRHAARKETDAALLALQKKVIANPALTPTQLASMGVKQRAKPSRPKTPQRPIGLTVVGNEDGVNTLRWDRNGNDYGVMYLIEARVGNAADFVAVDTTKSKSYQHTGQTPGVMVTYRIKARNGKKIVLFAGQIKKNAIASTAFAIASVSFSIVKILNAIGNRESAE